MPGSASTSRDEVRRLIGRLPAQGLAAAPTSEGAVIVDLSKAADLQAAFALVRAARQLTPESASDPREPLEAALVALARALGESFGEPADEREEKERERHGRRAAR